MKNIVAIVLFVAATASAAELPSSFKICHKSQPEYSECISNATAQAIVALRGGLKSFKILPIEPLAVDVIRIGEAEGAVTLKQEYRNIKLYGLTKGIKMLNSTMDFDKLILNSKSYHPSVSFVADYKIDGKVLVLPVRGSGKCNITMFDMISIGKIYSEKYEKNGETYLKVKKYTVNFHPKRVTMRFDNLFDGDTLLGEQMNRFINENSDVVFKELQAPYEESFGLVFLKICNDIFSRVPMNKLFPE